MRADVARVGSVATETRRERLVEPTEAEVRLWMKHAARAVAARYGWHPQRDEIEAAALEGLWKAVRRAQETGACALSTAAGRGAAWGAKSWLQGPENTCRTHTRHLTLPERVELTLENEGFVHDFSPALDTKLSLEDTIEGCLAAGVLKRREWAIIVRTIVEGESSLDVAHDFGICKQRCWQIRDEGLKKLKAWLTNG